MKKLTKKNIVEFIKKMDNVSFAEIEHNFMNVKGEVSIGYLDSSYNLCIWFGVSEKLFDIITDLLKEEAITVVLCSFLVYVCDGIMPKHKIANQLRKYAQPRWLPVVLRVNRLKRHDNKN